MFKKGDRVIIDGDVFKGRAVVLHYATEPPKTERAYGIPYDPVYPQFGVESVEPDSFGNKILYNADDVAAGKVRLATDDDEWPTQPMTLREILEDITITREDWEGDWSRNLWDDVYPYHAILEPISTWRCVCPDIGREFLLGEFESTTIDVKAHKVGQSMRNHGEPAFVLKIHVDGYGPTTFSLNITEVFTY